MTRSAVLRGGSGATVVAVEPEQLRAGADPFDDAVEQARRAGYEEGRRLAAEESDASLARARAELEQRVAASVEHLESSALLVRAQLGEELDRLAKSATSLALALTEAILQRELVLAVDPGAEAIVRALALLPGDGPAVARCNPADLERIGEMDRPMLSFVPDAEVAPGGCVIDTGSTLVDARIETAMARVREILERAGAGDE